VRSALCSDSVVGNIALTESVTSMFKASPSCSQPTTFLANTRRGRFWLAVTLLCLFFAGAALRAVNVNQPLESPSWRNADIASIARNYYRESMNLLYPRVDWRGDGPGYVEMEFPLYPWMIAASYKVFGPNEIVGRFISYIFSLLAILVFFALARHLLPSVGAIAAGAFFVLSPLAIKISYSLQPEGLMFLSYLLASYAFLRWLDTDSWKYYCTALIATALAVLVKATAAHIGVFFLCALLYSRGLIALKDWRIWLFVAGSLLPAALWYYHAHTFWLIYGNSLGVSNEYHWVGWDFFTDPSFIQGILGIEFFNVFLPTGILIASIGIIFKRSEKFVVLPLYWFVAIFIYLIIAARTTAANWAAYYHVVSVIPASLLIGAGVEGVAKLLRRRHWLIVYGLITPWLVIVPIAYLLGATIPSFWEGSAVLFKLAMILWFPVYIIIVFLGGKINEWQRHNKAFAIAGPRGLTLTVLCMIMAVMLPFLLSSFRPAMKAAELRSVALAFSEDMLENGLVIVNGGHCKDPAGYSVAYNASYLFYWTDRKGWNVCYEDQSLDTIMSLVGRGARYFLLEKAFLRVQPGFEENLRATFPILREHSDLIIFRLDEGRSDG
jgi:hypothetical protein